MSLRRTRFAACLMLCATGCSVARYDADYATALETYRSEAPFAVLEPAAVEFATGALRVRVPQGFNAVATDQAAGRVDPSRLRPAFLDTLPGYQGTRERRFAADGVELPVSLAVWSLPAADGSRAALEKSLLDKARADEAFKRTEAVWADRQVVPRAGGPATWRVLSLTGPQIFESVVAGNQEYKRWDATCELWLAADPASDARTLLAWRLPAQAAGGLPMPLAELAETVARTVAIEPDAAGDEAAVPGGAAAESAPAAGP